MARSIAVDVIVPVEKAVANFLRLGRSAEKFGQILKETDVSTAQTRVAASAKRIQALRRESEQFSALSRTYKKGSDEQIAASRLAVGANKRLASALGLSAREAKRMGLSSAVAERDLGRATRGALAGSGIFRGFGRSLAFASAGFLGFQAVTGTVTEALHGAEDLSKAQEGLNVAIRNTGGNVKVLDARYTAVAKSAAQFGVSQVDATTALERATVLTGGAARAQRAYQEALVISKATGKDFNSVLTATAKAQEGITTSLKRYGIEVKKGMPGWQQLNLVMSRFRGEATANTSAADRFRAVWANTEVILGQALLPVLDKYLTKLSDWLEKMQRSGRLQRDVNRAVHDATSIFKVLASVLHGVDRVTGSLKHTLELLLALKVASVLARWAGAFRGLGGSAVVAEGEVGGLRGALIRLGGAEVLGPLSAVAAAVGAIGLSAYELAHSKAPTHVGGTVYRDNNTGQYYLQHLGGRAAPGISPGRAADLTGSGGNFGGGSEHGHHRHSGPLAPRGRFGNQDTTDPSSRTGVTDVFKLPPGLVTQQERAKAGFGSLLKADEAIRRYILNLLRSDKLRGKGLQDAYKELAKVNGEIASQVKKAAAAAKKARDAAKKAADQYSIPLKLQLAEARAQALGINDRAILLKEKRAAERALKSGKLGLQGQIDAWNTIAQINSQLASQTNTQTAQFKEANTRALTAGLGLSAAQRAQLRARLAQRGPGNTVPNHGTGAYGYRIGHNDRPIVIHHTTKIDGKKVEHSVTRHQQRRRRRNSTQRRGPNAGG